MNRDCIGLIPHAVLASPPLNGDMINSLRPAVPCSMSPWPLAVSPLGIKPFASALRALQFSRLPRHRYLSDLLQIWTDPLQLPALQVKPSRPPNTSSPTPPLSTHIPTILFRTVLLIPPFVALQAPSLPPSSFPTSLAAADILDGGSIVLTASRSKPLSSPLLEDAPTVTASTASATASSEWVGSKNIFCPTDITRRVIGGRREGVDDLAFGEGEPQRGREASQSSLKRGSSSWVDIGAGRRAVRRARCVVKDRRGSG